MTFISKPVVVQKRSNRFQAALFEPLLNNWQQITRFGTLKRRKADGSGDCLLTCRSYYVLPDFHDSTIHLPYQFRTAANLKSAWELKIFKSVSNIMDLKKVNVGLDAILASFTISNHIISNYQKNFSIIMASIDNHWVLF